MLTIGIEYLNGWALATHPADRNSPEWPPHPDRIFMAMAAAHFETDGDQEERALLEWIEQLGNPILYASPPSRENNRTAVTTYVPVNDTQISRMGTAEKRLSKINLIDSLNKLKDAGLMVHPDYRLRQARTFTITIPEEPLVMLQWNVDISSEQQDKINSLCQKVTSIGHSASLVRMWVEQVIDPNSLLDEGKHQKLTPLTGGRYSLRVFGPGRLADLEARYNKSAIEDYAALQKQLSECTGKQKKEVKLTIEKRYGGTPPQSLRPTAGLWQGYDLLKPEPVRMVYEHTHWSDDLIVLRKLSGKPLGLHSTLQLTNALRGTCMQHCPDPVPDWLSGHQADNKPGQRPLGHVAFLPLPHIGSPHADGHLLGLGIAIPRDVPDHELRHALGKLLYKDTGETATIQLKLGKLGTWNLELDDQRDFRMALKPETWTSADTPAKRWGTVTPIALDRHAKGDNPSEEICNIIADGCERIGLSRPVDVILSRVSMFIGTPGSHEMPRIQRKKDHGEIRHVHAVITFPDPIVGPVIVCAGRYRGYGFCRPLSAEV